MNVSFAISLDFSLLVCNKDFLNCLGGENFIDFHLVQFVANIARKANLWELS